MRAKAAKSSWKGRLIRSFLSYLLISATLPAFAASDNSLIRNNIGSVGLIDMPSARMAPDGELSVGASFFQNTQHYNFGFQILPWLETSFRYSGLAHFDADFPVYYDRSFGIKARLWDEGRILPAVAVGINDLVGTGVYSGEYAVATKSFGPLDTTLGIGWGRLGSTALFQNPFTSISNSFESRPPLATPGGAHFNVFYHGASSGLFGGVVWHTPISGLSLIAEYSSDAYKLEAGRGNFVPRNQVNYGASYQISDGITLGLDWLYGRSVGGNISFQLNPFKPQYPSKLGTPPIPATVRTNDQQQFALQVMRQQGKPSAFRSASANRAGFVDALWRQNGLDNIEVDGHSLIVTADGDPGHRCIINAQLAQSYGVDIRTIFIKGSDGRLATQCITADAALPAYQVIPTAASPLDVPIAVASKSFAAVTIDAVGSDIASAKRSIRTDARGQKIEVTALAFSGGVATVYYVNSHYFAEVDALERLTRVLMKNAPPEIEKFRLISMSKGVPQQEFNILRGPEERKFIQSDNIDLFGDVPSMTISPPPLQNPVLAEADQTSYPKFSWSIFPQLRQELFDPENPFALQLTAGADASLQLRPGLSVNGAVETSLFDNFNTARQSNSPLPHVRSDFLKYFAQGKTGIGELDTEYRFRLTPTVFAIAKAGYLESMFAGAGGEVLWRPEGQRWALGIDAYEVWQRGFDRLLDLADYRAFTGHVSLYYASPWHDLNFMLMAGQYLAGDRGLTFQVTRRFSTGVEIGAFFTKTNISSAQFGEGSFDKGILIRIPLGWALPIETQGQWGIDIRPVQRDGGQRLVSDVSLYNETLRTSVSELSKAGMSEVP